MSDFVDRLERELLAAGRRSRTRPVARPYLGRAIPLLLSFGVTGAVVAVIIVVGLTHSTSPPKVTTTRPQPTASTTRPKGFGPRACHFRSRSRRIILPPLIKSTAAPSGALLSQAGFLRAPATAADRFSVRSLDRWPWRVLAVYARYIRIISGPGKSRIAVIPAVVCGLSSSPSEMMLMQVMSTPRGVARATIELGTAADIRTGAANGYIDNSYPSGTGLWVSVVPDDVARVVLRFPGHRPATASMTIDQGIGIADPVPQYAPASITWYAASGAAIRTFHAPPVLP